MLINKSKYSQLTRNNFIISKNKKMWIMGKKSIEVHSFDGKLDYVIDENTQTLVKTHDMEHGTVSLNGKFLYFTEQGHIFSRKNLLNHTTKQILKLPGTIENYKILSGGETLYFVREVQGKKEQHSLYVTNLELYHQTLKLFSLIGKILNFKIYKCFNGPIRKYFVLILSQNAQFITLNEIVFGYDAYMKVNISRNSEIFCIKRKQKFTKNKTVNRNHIQEFVYNKHDETIFVFNIKEKISDDFHKFELEIFTKSIKFQNKIEIGNFYNDLALDNWQRQHYQLDDNTDIEHISIRGYQTDKSKFTIFLFQSDNYISLNKIERVSRTFSLNKIYQDNEKQLVKVNPLKNRFYVLKNNLLNVLRLETGEFLLEYKLDFNRFIPKFCDSNDILIIYDYSRLRSVLKRRHEIDLDNLQTTKCSKILTDRESIEAQCNTMASDSHLAGITLRSYREAFYGCVVPNNLAWDVAHIPIGFVPDLFKKEKYRQSLRIFANFYFSFISKYDGVDHFFGELNPLFICVYHKDSVLLEELLNKHYYPEIRQNSNFSPLKYAFDLKYFACISCICEYSLKSSITFPKFTYEDFHCLLTSNKPICHMVLSRFFTLVDSELVPNFIQMKGKFKFDFKDSLLEYVEANSLSKDPLVKPQAPNLPLNGPSNSDYRGMDSRAYLNSKSESKINEAYEIPFDDELVSSFEQDYFYNELKYEYRSVDQTGKEKKIDYYKHKNKHDPKEVDTFQLSIKIDTSLGSKEMIYFLFHYGNSNCNDFINSKWRYLVIERWIKFWPVHLINAVFYWIFTMCVAMMIILESESSLLYLLNFIFIIVLFLVNAIRFIGFIRVKRVPTNYLNIIDVATLPLVLSYLFIPLLKRNNYQVKLLFLFVLFLLFFRSITHLSIIPTFTSIIKIVNTIIIKMIPFLTMVFVFYISVVFMVIYIRDEDNNEDGLNDTLSISDCFIRVYYWVIFGGLGEGDFKLDLSMVPLIIGPVFIGVILMNIMIGFLSNEYSRLEELQKVKNLIYKAEINLDVEIICYLVFSLFKIKTISHPKYLFLTSPEKSELDDPQEEQEEINQTILKQQNKILSTIVQKGSKRKTTQDLDRKKNLKSNILEDSEEDCHQNYKLNINGVEGMNRQDSTNNALQKTSVNIVNFNSSLN